MKKSCHVFLFLLIAGVTRAASASSPTMTTQEITIPGSSYTVDFGVDWACDDFPRNSAPGRIELVDGSGTLVGRVVASVYRPGTISVSVTGTGSVTNTNAWVAVYAPNGTPADGALTATWNITSMAPGNYTLRLYHYTTWETTLQASTVWTSTTFFGGSVPTPANTSPSVALLGPGNQTVTAGTTLTISSHATDPDGNIASHNLDIQRPAGDWNFQGGFATGEPFQGGPAGSGGDSTRSASFTFSDVGTYTVRSAADDGGGWVHSATSTITVVAPPSVQYSLTTEAGAGGTVSPGGTYDADTVVSISATPDGSHDFAGWAGDAAGSANPLAVTLDRDRTIRANFSPRTLALTTSATAGGGVTPGGYYPPGTSVTVSATPDAMHRFVGWTGDASGTAPSIVVTLNSPLNVQAVFTDKAAQTITFEPPASQAISAPLTLAGTASSGLPITYTLLSGPAALIGGEIQLTGPGPVTVQASQAGDAFFLSAPPVTRTFNAVAAALIRYRLATRTLLQTATNPHGTTYVLEQP